MFFPGLFLSIFHALRDMVTALVSGAFSFSGLAGQLALLLVMFLLTALWGRLFCRNLCPLGALFALSSGPQLFRIRRKETACNSCGLCSRTCAMGVSVHDREAVHSGECIDCTRCVGVFRNEALCSNPHPA